MDTPTGQKESIGDALSKFFSGSAVPAQAQTPANTEPAVIPQTNPEENNPDKYFTHTQLGAETATADGYEFDPTIELVINDDLKETFDITDEEQKKKLLEYARNWKINEPKITELTGKEESIKISETQMANAIRLMYSQQLYGDLNEDNLIEKPFDFYLEEAGHDRKKAMELWKEDKQRIQRVNEFAGNFAEATQKFQQVKNAFKTNHPEIADIDGWIKDNVNEYIEGFITFGEKPIKEDTFEMLYFWKNKDKILADYKQQIIKEIAGTKPTPPEGKSGRTVRVGAAKSSGDSTVDMVQSALDGIRKKYEGKKLLAGKL